MYCSSAIYLSWQSSLSPGSWYSSESVVLADEHGRRGLLSHSLLLPLIAAAAAAAGCWHYCRSTRLPSPGNLCLQRSSPEMWPSVGQQSSRGSVMLWSTQQVSSVRGHQHEPAALFLSICCHGLLLLPVNVTGSSGDGCQTRHTKPPATAVGLDS